MWDGFRQNFSIALSEFDKNESGLNKLPIDFKNTLAMKNSYIYLDEEGISTLKTDNLGRNGNLKVTNIKGKIITTRNFYNWLEFNFRACPKFCVSIIHSELYLKEGEQKMTKKIKKEPDAIDKVVDYFLENIDNPQDLFKGNTIFQEFTKKLTERMLNTEIKDYLETDENHNKRNGNTQKTIITKNGSIAIDVPRDRNSTFEPVIIPKRQRRFDNFDQKVISLYARGMTISDIKAQLQEFYHGAEISESLISQITDDVIEEVKMWQTKPLEKIYPIVYFDCIVVKVKQDKRIINKAVYLALGINLDGLKDILGMWISENEGAKFWLNNLTEMKNRGLQDILVACSDNLTGMSDAIEAVFPKTQHQLCIVHQIRNSLKFVPVAFSFLRYCFEEVKQSANYII